LRQKYYLKDFKDVVASWYLKKDERGIHLGGNPACFSPEKLGKPVGN
jgi:hypothetical protein